jgi:muramoyltetrapeptide carboxypeptidase LdcA involved in peptidoglycan recycling
VHRVVGELGIPVAYGLRSGHVESGNITLPMGVQALLEVDHRVRLTFTEAAVEVPEAHSA